jgi:transposase-like protein
MPKKQPRYSIALQRSAVEQVLHHHIPIAQVARQLDCSDQSIQRWIKLHRKSLPPPNPSTTFLPIQVGDASSHPNSPKIAPLTIELITRTGLALRFPVDTPADTLLNLVRRLEGVPC